MPADPIIASLADRPREAWDDPHRGSVSWFTLFSSDRTPTEAMSAGVAELPPGGGALGLHRHAEPEIYYILEGTGTLMTEGRETIVTVGQAVFIPGDAPHGLRNDTDKVVKLFYVFPTGNFEDIVYRFDE